MNSSVWVVSEVAFWASLMVSAISAMPILKLLKAMKARQTVSQYAPEGHAKKQGTPTMGGLIIVVGFCASMALMIATNSNPYGTFVISSLGNDRHVHPFLPLGSSTASELGPMLGLFLAFALIGFVDDFVVPRMFIGKRGLGWKQKILMQFVAAGTYAFLVYRDLPGAGALSVFLILFFSNAYNFADGLDALAGSILLGLCGGLTVFAALTGTFVVILPLMALIGATIPFLYLNAPPAKVFMGDVGSLGIGAVLGAIVMMLGTPSIFVVGSSGWYAWVPCALAVSSLLMVVELVPVPLQIASVKLRKKKIFPYTPIHHAFEKAGWAETRVVWCFALTQLLLSAAAIGILLLSGIPMAVFDTLNGDLVK